MAAKTFYLVHAQARSRCAEFVMIAPEGWRVGFDEPKRKDAQNDKYHSMIGDISRQGTYAGKRWDEEDTKRILIDEFAAEMRKQGKPLHHDGRLILSEDGHRVIQLGIQSRDFYVSEAANFIEYLYAWGADRDVKWSEYPERGVVTKHKQKESK